MTTSAAGERYDEYWTVRDRERTRARSVVRATLALELLAAHGHTPPRSLLDVGCGPGYALEEFARAGYDAEGVDASEVAAHDAAARGLRVRVGDIEAAAPAGARDVVVALEVLEHLVEPLGALRRMVGLTAPSGVLVVSLPNEFHILRRIALLFGRAPSAGHDDPHLRYFDDRLARRLFDAAGLRVLARRSDGLAPPRRPLARKLLAPALRILPGWFALSNVYLLSRDDAGPSRATEIAS